MTILKKKKVVQSEVYKVYTSYIIMELVVKCSAFSVVNSIYNAERMERSLILYLRSGGV